MAKFDQDERFSLTALTKLEHGFNIPVLTKLKACKLWKLKDKAVFDLKIDEERGSYEPALYVYINSWLEDNSAGCCPTWRNLLTLLGEIGLGELAQGILAILSSNSSGSGNNLSMVPGKSTQT